MCNCYKNCNMTEQKNNNSCTDLNRGWNELDLAIATLTREDKINMSPILQNETFSQILDCQFYSKADEAVEFSNNQQTQNELNSSDEEDVKNFLEQKYNQYGRDINEKLKLKEVEVTDDKINREVNNFLNEKSLFKQNQNRVSKVTSNNLNKINNARFNSMKRKILSSSNKHLQQQQLKSPNSSKEFQQRTDQLIDVCLQKVNKADNVYKDPVFGMRLINPLVASSILVERMQGRKAVTIAGLQYHIEHADLSQDWVVAGCIVNKSSIKETQKGGSFCIWKISDLKGEIKTVSLFLFGTAYSSLWKTSIGDVVAVLNPRLFNKKKGDKTCVASVSIDKDNQVMILGKSKDFGICKAKKKNGENCSAIVNLGECNFCIYHVKQEFDKMSKRSDIQSSTAGRGLQELKNKILGKNEIFYGGQSFIAIPAKKSAKLTKRDQERMMSLSEHYHNPNASNINHTSREKTEITEVPYALRNGIMSKLAGNVEVNLKQRLKDFERLKLLKKDETCSEILNSVPNLIMSSKTMSQCSSLKITEKKINFNKFEDRKLPSFLNKKPTLNKDNFSLDINFNSYKIDAAKLNAIKILKNKPIEKLNPNFIKYRGTINGKKRAIDELFESYNEPEAKRKKLEQEKKTNEAKTRIQKIMLASSSHTNLLKLRELEEQEKYFNKLEKKEKLEEKMLSTFKIACKAVICLKCKYTALSASDRCKDEHHTLKVIDAEKRFFECQDCSNRTVSLDKIPKQTCSNCKSSRWKRAPMMKERKLVEPGSDLSIRGDEEKFLSSLSSKSNLHLLVGE